MFLYCIHVCRPPRDSNILYKFNVDVFEQIEIGIEQYKLSSKTLVTGDPELL